MIMQHDISSKDLEMVYLSPSPYNNAFEAELDLKCYNPTIPPTAGLMSVEKLSHLFLQDMQPGTPAAKIQAWRSCLPGAQIIKVNYVEVSLVSNLEKALLSLTDSGVV